jgi:hypothetical protein
MKLTRKRVTGMLLTIVQTGVISVAGFWLITLYNFRSTRDSLQSKLQSVLIKNDDTRKHRAAFQSAAELCMDHIMRRIDKLIDVDLALKSGRRPPWSPKDQAVVAIRDAETDKRSLSAYSAEMTGLPKEYHAAISEALDAEESAWKVIQDISDFQHLPPNSKRKLRERLDRALGDYEAAANKGLVSDHEVDIATKTTASLENLVRNSIEGELQRIYSEKTQAIWGLVACVLSIGFLFVASDESTPLVPEPDRPLKAEDIPPKQPESAQEPKENSRGAGSGK